MEFLNVAVDAVAGPWLGRTSVAQEIDEHQPVTVRKRRDPPFPVAGGGSHTVKEHEERSGNPQINPVEPTSSCCIGNRVPERDQPAPGHGRLLLANRSSAIRGAC
jgi:hypothetical protein